MNKDTITIVIKGVEHYFNGDELTSPEQEAIMFLQKQEKDKEIF